MGATRGATKGGAHNMGIRPDTIQNLKRPKTGDAAPFCSHTECSMRLLELELEPKEVSHHHDSNASKITSFGRRMREISPKPCRGVGLLRDERELVTTCNLGKAMA